MEDKSKTQNKIISENNRNIRDCITATWPLIYRNSYWYICSRLQVHWQSFQASDGIQLWRLIALLCHMWNRSLHVVLNKWLFILLLKLH